MGADAGDGGGCGRSGRMREMGADAGDRGGCGRSGRYGIDSCCFYIQPEDKMEIFIMILKLMIKVYF